MRLSKIKLAGFKSFVDPTTVHFPSNLVGVLGPNGCGKSNVIDAVRWVMGESAASRLRGDAMADVIFSGSASRKPVGQAMVELVFDNSLGRLGGAWAGFSEIAVRRQVNRDGQSGYFLNGARCRRRDITDLFLGTGLGPRSYAIIEQGMISRVIEARAEDLRGFFEEAAGISRYKERRRETETRIRHTRDNLERLADVREELDKRLVTLQRQARQAEQYRELRAEERRVRAELLALRWRAHDVELAARERAIAAGETQLAAILAEQRGVEAALAGGREHHAACAAAVEQAQARAFALATELARVEQALEAARGLRTRNREELARSRAALDALAGNRADDLARRDQLAAALAEDEPRAEALAAAGEAAQAQLAAVERELHAWQAAWDAFAHEAAAAQRRAEVERARIEACERRLLDHERRGERLRLERGALAAAGLAQALAEADDEARRAGDELAAAQRRLADAEAALAGGREALRAAGTERDTLRARVAAGRGRLASLETLQEAALGGRDEPLAAWLAALGLGTAGRLAQVLEVEPGWEAAVECVLGGALEAVCVEALDGPAARLAELARGSLCLFETTATASAPPPADALAARVRAPWPLQHLFGAVRTVPDLATALAARTALGPGESLVAPDGTWLGRDWLRAQRGGDAHAGVLAREREIHALRDALGADQAALAALAAHLDALQEALGGHEAARREAQEAVNLGHRAQAQAQAQAGTLRARNEQNAARHAAIEHELDELRAHAAEEREVLAEARLTLEAALEAMQGGEAERAARQAERERLRAAQEAARGAARETRETALRLAVELGSRRTALASVEQALARLAAQHDALATRCAQLDAELAAAEPPLAELAAQLDAGLAQRLACEAALTAAREAAETAAARLRELEHARGGCELRHAAARERLEAERLAGHEAQVRRQALAEQLAALDADPAAILPGVPASATEAAWQARLDELAARLQRLGNVNLTAIEEFAEVGERKRYLDAQHADLVEALGTLEAAIRKIDRETRARLRETFERVNAGLETLFPRLFGGGRAYLELTGEDVLDAGVAIMAQPPGKRVGNIHLLSGGEKALTAVALVFAIFQLNPAPFCMLDEVDAPLDEANVGRFGQLLREMAERVQFIFITHNKATMEVADHLAGVTMHEPGVSRIVAVDVDEAVRLAAV